MLNELRELGHNYANVNEIFKDSRIESEKAGVILKWLPSVYQENVGSADQLVRSVISEKIPYDANVLIDLFEGATLNKSLKSNIAHVLSYSPTHDISKWMIYQLSNEPYSFEKASLIAGILEKKYMSQAEGLNFIRRLFDKYPYAVLDEIKKYGTKDETDFLLDKFNQADTGVKSEIKKVLKAIDKKVSKSDRE